MKNDDLENTANECNEGQMNEPESTYLRPKIRFFDSPEKQRIEMYIYWASLTPVQRLSNLLEMIKVFYNLTPETLANPKLEMKIKFRIKS